MRNFIIYFFTFVIVIGVLVVAFDIRNFTVSGYLADISKNLKELDLKSFIATAQNFPDFSGDFIDILEDIFNLLLYPINLIIEFVKILLGVLENFVVLFGGVFS